MRRLSRTEWLVLLASQDVAHGGAPATPERVARELPEFHPATVKRTRRRLESWGLVRGDGTRVRLAPRPRAAEPYAGEPTAAERAELAAALAEAEGRHARALALAGLCVDVLTQKTPAGGILPTRGATPLDMILCVNDDATPAEASAFIIQAVRGIGAFHHVDAV